MAGTKINPDDVWGPNEYYAQHVGLAPAIGIPMEAGGNTVDRARFVEVAGTKNVLSKNQTQNKPLGQSGTTGF